MNNFFVNITEDLNIKKDFNAGLTTPQNLDDILEKFDTHPSILKIKQKLKNNESFSFQLVTEDQVRKEILNLNGSKATPIGDISVNLLKLTVDVHLTIMTNIINLSIEKGCFPDDLKLAEVSPIFKKKDNLNKANYRPVSVLSHVSKVFERIMYNQINDYMSTKLSKFLTGFRKNHNTQHCLMNMLEKWREMLDKGKYVCAIFMDLSKAFDTLNHDLLIAKLGAYGFEKNALIYIKSYLTNRKQRVRVNNSFSEWEEIRTGVPQGSILGPLLFNIFLNDLFLFVSNSHLSNYADDNTLYNFGDNVANVKVNLRKDLEIVSRWFYENYMVLNADKCHFMCLGKNTETETFLFNDIIMENSKEERILGILIDNKLTFRSHIIELCKKTSQKIAALSRLSNYLTKSEKKLIFDSVIKSQFSYCPLVWMFSSRTSNNMINKLHERSLRIVLEDFTSDFKTLLQNNNDISNHHRNIQTLLTELFKVRNGLAPPQVETMFQRRNNTYNLRGFQEFQTERKRTVDNGLETLSYRAPQLWSLLPEEVKQTNSLSEFKRSVRQWTCTDCPCRLCKTYVPNLGFL